MEFIDSKKGKPVLLHAGHRYNFVKTNKSSTNWKCLNKSTCNTSITLDFQNRIIKKSKHTCSPDKTRNLVDVLVDGWMVCTNIEPIPKIYEDYTDKVKHKLKQEDIPNFVEKKDSLYNARNRFLSLERSTSNDVKNLKLQNILVDGLFVYDDGIEDKMIIFGTPLAKMYLKKYKKFYGDGTFKIAPQLFYQLYSSHVNMSDEDHTLNFVPLVYILLTNKTQSTYERLFVIPKNQFHMNIEEYKCDFELAVIQAVKIVYPNVKISGCYYHYWRAVSKHSEKIGFNKTEGGYHVTNLFMQLALLSPILIPEGFLTINELGNESEEYKKFNTYFATQWMGKITQKAFSCYNEKIRTNNPIEGWHRRLKNRFPLKLNINQFLDALKKETIYQDRQIKKNEIFCPGKRRSAKLLEKDRKINKIIASALCNDISVLECLNRLCTVNLVHE